MSISLGAVLKGAGALSKALAGFNVAKKVVKEIDKVKIDSVEDIKVINKALEKTARPIWLQRRYLSLAVGLLASLVGLVSGVSLSPEDVSNLVNGLSQGTDFWFEHKAELFTIGGLIWMVILKIIGTVKRVK
jgi:hypothetical protein